MCTVIIGFAHERVMQLGVLRFCIKVVHVFVPFIICHNCIGQLGKVLGTNHCGGKVRYWGGAGTGNGMGLLLTSPELP